MLNKIKWSFCKFIYRFYSDEYCMCDLCCRAVHYTKTSDYYEDVTACKICCPDGYRDYEAEALAGKI